MGYVGKIQDTAGNTHLVGSTLFGTCSTTGATAAKVVTCSNFNELVEGVTIHVYFNFRNTAGSSTTLNVNNTGAKSVVVDSNHTASGDNYSWEGNSIVSFTYYNSKWYMNDFHPDVYFSSGTVFDGSKHPIILSYYDAATWLANNYSTQMCDSGTVVDGTSGSVFVPLIDTSTGWLDVEKISSDGTNYYSIGPAAEKGIDTSVPSGSTSTNVPTTAAVAAAIDQATGGAAGALVYKGPAATLTDITDTNYEKGWYWIASAAFSWTGPNSTTVTVEPGDMIIAHQAKTSTVGNDLDAIQTNIETLTTTEVSNLWTAAVAVS